MKTILAAILLAVTSALAGDWETAAALDRINATLSMQNRLAFEAAVEQSHQAFMAQIIAESDTRRLRMEIEAARPSTISIKNPYLSDDAITK